VLRIPAFQVETIYSDAGHREQIAGFEVVKAREIALVMGTNYTTVRRRLKRESINRNETAWEHIQGKWNLPHTLTDFRRILKEKLGELRTQRASERAEHRLQIETERQRRTDLRTRLVAAFPTWQHEGRQEQRIYLHIGPPNSGKTHDALNALASVGEGWYLAPLRLLAFEIFDRLNQHGVRCNLLTGEEYIPVEGATITAATVEMFNPNRSGECVVLDEAQMLADPDRGWAWTRALMEAQSPRIHVIGPPTARALIERMATAAAMSLTLVKHDRLASVQIAERSWNLRDLPPRTILVAFSRQTVLELKTELERHKRSVSVVYGSLPPEVRRRQADRFADGQTEICVATDAVGMGLNLPADYVCFYEVKKYDGKQTRLLTASEVQQIGGRAGRYGLSQGGEVGATTSKDLKVLRSLFYAATVPLSHARVAPTVPDLEMIPGSLAERLAEWASLKSIPESLHGAIEVADMTERVELASMLSEHEVKHLGLAGALQLVNAPTRQSSRAYWYNCARAILAGKALPLPPVTIAEVTDSDDLERLETYISYADIYLWLSRRKEFDGCGPDADDVRHLRVEWSNAIDRGLLRRLDIAKRCSRCHKPLPRNHRHPICDDCYHEHVLDNFG
jgi:ATP-dependent RNA helicase SUPV3L1/SUV3